MIVLAVSTFRWATFKEIRTFPLSSTIIAAATMVVVIGTPNLALGVLTGVALSGILFAWKLSRATSATISHDSDTHPTYAVKGQVLFVSAIRFVGMFDYYNVPTQVTIDVSGAHIWDTTAVGALDKVLIKFRRLGAHIKVTRQNQASQLLIDRIGPYPLVTSATH